MICTVKVLTTCGVFDFDLPEGDFLVRVTKYLDEAIKGIYLETPMEGNHPDNEVLSFGAFPEVWRCRADVIRGYVIRKRTETKAQQQWSKLVEAMTDEMQSGSEWQ